MIAVDYYLPAAADLETALAAVKAILSGTLPPKGAVARV